MSECRASKRARKNNAEYCARQIRAPESIAGLETRAVFDDNGFPTGERRAPNGDIISF